MGYLHIPSSAIPNFSKAVISLWFRIPAETFATVNAITDTLPVGFSQDHSSSRCYTPPLYKIIPLLTFGSLEVDDLSKPCQPSFIGVDVYASASVLACNLQTPVFATSPITPERAECFYMGGAAVSPGDQTTISADQWHHILISFDISGSASANYATSPYTFVSSNTFSWALDDVSKVGPSMDAAGGGRWAEYGLATNQIISQGLIDYTPGAVGENTGSVTGTYIASSGNAIGIPSSATFVSNIYMVEMAELQFYTGVTLDASDSTNRRAFVTSEGRPQTDFTIPDALLGKSPEFRIRAKSGVNLGTSGALTKVGTINDYTPGPSL